MHRIMRTMRSLLLGAAAAAIFVATTYRPVDSRPPKRGESLHRDPQGLGAPEDTVG